MIRFSIRTAALSALLFGVLFAVDAALHPAEARRSCTADCDDDRTVTIDELLRCVAIGLNATELNDCGACDPSSNQLVSVDELIRAVRIALGVNVLINGQCTFVNGGEIVACPTDTEIEFRRCDDANSCLTSSGTGVDPESTSFIDIGCADDIDDCPIDANGNYRYRSTDCRVVDAPVIASTSVMADGSPMVLRSVGFTQQAVSEIVANVSVFSEAAVFVLLDIGVAQYDPTGYAPLIAAVEESETARDIDFGTLEVIEIAPALAAGARADQDVEFILIDFGCAACGLP